MAKRQLPSPEVVRQLLNYEPETGKLFWKERFPEQFSVGRASPDRMASGWNIRFAGKEAFTPINSKGYHTGAIWGKMLLAHRVAWVIVHGRWPEHFLDHINGNRSDNRLCNLREATHAENSRNSGLQSNNTSGVRGVRLDARCGRWQARITVNQRQKHLGYFASAEEAAEAYAAGARKYHGEFARLT